MTAAPKRPHNAVNDAAFAKILPYLDPEDDGKIAVMENGKLIGLFEHMGEAYEAGAGRWHISATPIVVARPGGGRVSTFSSPEP